MGRKVHPIGFRLGIIKEHKSRWFASGKQYTNQLAEDRSIRGMVFQDPVLAKASVSNVDIERQPNQVHVIIDTARPGVIIGKKGESVNKLRTELQKLTQKKVKIDVREITKPELDSRLVAESIAEQLERRISWKRAMKQAAQKTMRVGAKGVMITVSGRLGGSDMGRVDIACAMDRFPAIRCAPISTMVRRKPTRPSASSVLRCGSTWAKSCPAKNSTPATSQSRSNGAG